MRLNKKAISLLMTSALLVGTASCGGGGGRQAPASTDNQETLPAATTTLDPNKEFDIEVDYEGIADEIEIDAKDEEGAGKLYTPGQKAGVVKAMCYYDIAGLGADAAQLFAERFGGTVETEIVNNLEYFDKMAIRVAAGDSPDLVRYDWPAFPDGVVRGRYEALDDWLDINAPIWSSEKSLIEQFAFKGKHYYFPENFKANFAIHYNKLLIDEMGMDDPMQLYFNDEWTWDKFEDMLKIWSSRGDEYIGFTGGSWTSMQFINTTGTKTFEVTDTDIINNLRSPNVTRTMEWLEGLAREGYCGQGYVDPGEAFIDGKLLFLSMEYTWGHEAAQEGLNKKHIDSDMCAVPFPRDPKADKYYQTADSVGYMVPKGANNIQGAVQWILVTRIKATDPDIVAEKRAFMQYDGPYFYPKCPNKDCKYNFEEHGQNDLDTCPECGTARKPKFKYTYSDDMMRVYDDLMGGDKFEFLFDNAYGFSNDIKELFINTDDSIFDGPLWKGGSFTQNLEAYNSVVEAGLDTYRSAMNA